MFKKIIAALALVIIGLFAAPLAANADYASHRCSVSGDAVPGGTVTASCPDGTFAPNDPIVVTVSGNGAVTVAVFKAGTSSTTKTSSSTGAVSATIHLPSDASGAYDVTFTDSVTGRTAGTSFTVGSANGGGSGSGNGSGSGSVSGSGLADTGSTVSILAFWAGGGIVLLGIAFVAVRVVVRRQSRSNA